GRRGRAPPGGARPVPASRREDPGNSLKQPSGETTRVEEDAGAVRRVGGEDRRLDAEGFVVDSGDLLPERLDAVAADQADGAAAEAGAGEARAEAALHLPRRADQRIQGAGAHLVVEAEALVGGVHQGAEGGQV